jgi:PIN domain nuclease of toxin-antitoxin system
MHGYLLDTHIAIWFLTGDTLLSQTAERIIRDRTNRAYLSVVSAWELSIKINIGKLRFPGNASGFIRSVQANDIAIIPIETAHLTALESLPLLHRDPFDRLLVATAVSEQLTLISADKNIAHYNVPLIW